MANFLVGSDRDGGSHEMDDIKRVSATLRACGHSVKESPAPNSSFEGELTAEPDGTIGVMIVNGGAAGATYASFIRSMQGKVPNSQIIFLFCYWHHPDNKYLTNESIQNDIYIAKHDSGDFYQSWMEQIYGGKTEAQLEAEYGFIHFCGSARSPEEGAQMICDGTCGQSSGTTQSGGGSAVKIPDLTFYGVINQICGAIDGLFIIANNMAYLLSFRDYYKYREQYDQYIPKIEPEDVLSESLTKEWANEGFYNSVEVKYNNGTINFSYDTLVQKYGENKIHYDLPDDDRETATIKAKSLLSAHIRDYSFDIYLQCLYNQNITVGSWIKLSTKVITVSDNQKTTEQDYELFFVQGYTLKWNEGNSLVMNLHLKYGPDTPDDPINATFGTGAIESSTGLFGNDCFSGDDLCPANSTKIMGHYSGSGGTATCKSLVNSKYMPTQQNYAPRANANSSYAQDLAGKTPAEAFYYFMSHTQYCLYADFCNLTTKSTSSANGDCCSVLWDAVLSGQIKGFNCGDSMRMLKVFFDCTNLKAAGVHITDHYFNCVEIDGVWEIIDGTRSNANNTTGFPSPVRNYSVPTSSTICSPCV